MAAQSLSGFDAMLRNVALITAAQDQFNNSSVLLSQLKRITRTVDGGSFAAEAPDTATTNRGWLIPTRQGRNLSIQAVADAATLPAGGHASLTPSWVRRAFNYGILEVTAPTMTASKGAGGFAQAMASEMKWLISDFSSDINRQLFGRGYGDLCRVTDANTGTTLTVVATGSIPINKFIQNGQSLAAMFVANTTFVPSLGTVFTAGTTVSSVTALTATLSAAATIKIGTYIVKANATSDSINREMMGLLGIVDCYTANTSFLRDLQAINRSSSSWWSANTVSGSGAALSAAMIQQAIDECFIDGGQCDLIITTPGGRAAYTGLGASALGLYKTTQDYELKGGWKAVSVNGIPMVVDKDAYQPPNAGATEEKPVVAATCSYTGVMYMLDTSSMALCQESEPNWADDDGHVLFRMANKDSYEARWRWYSNLAAFQPSANCRLFNFVTSY